MGLRGDWREDPQRTAAELVTAVLLNSVVAVLWPRALTYRSRRSLRQHVRAIAVSSVARTVAHELLLPWLRETIRVQEEAGQRLATELGRQPTPEELEEEMRRRVADSS